jgi:predicted GTPase
MVNGIRERFDLKGAPIRLQLKRTDNPFADRE